jgi:aryl-alcohol dehydrogenase-like predicted oxidoreductase
MVHWPIDANSMAHFAGGHASFGEAITTVNNDEVPPNEQAFRDLLAAQASGKIKHIGCSNFGVTQLKEVMALGVTVAVNELCYSLIFRAIEFEIAPFCKANDIQVLCYSPLQQGILTNRSLNCADDVPVYRARTRHFSGKRDKSRHGEEGHEELLFDTLRSLRSIAEAEKLTMLELSLAWPLHNPAVSCIIAGITKDEHVQSNAAASKVQLSAECLAKVDEATTALKNAMGSNADLWQGGADGRIK